MIVRRIGRGDDLSGAIKLLQKFFREEGFDTPDEVIAANVERMAAIDACAIIVAEEGAETAGVATLSFEFGIEFGWSAEMGDLYIAKPWRGQGLARKITSFAEALLGERGAAGYQVTVTPFAEQHHGLTEFYSKLGFRDEGRRLMFKPLTPRDCR